MNKELTQWLKSRNLIHPVVKGGVGTPPRTPPRRAARPPPPSPEEAPAPPVEPINPAAVLQRLNRRLELEPDSEPSTRTATPVTELDNSDSDSDSECECKQPTGGRLSKVVSKIIMSRKDFYNEHHKLISMLRSTAKRLSDEADEQEKEMLSYKNKLSGGMYCGNKRPPPAGETVGSTLQCFKKGIGIGMVIEKNKIPSNDELNDMSLRKLGELARQLKISKYSRMKKDDLIEEIIKARA